jgi:glycogen synthase
VHAKIALANILVYVIGLSKERQYKIDQRVKNNRMTVEFSMEKACERFNAVYREIISEGNS